MPDLVPVNEPSIASRLEVRSKLEHFHFAIKRVLTFSKFNPVDFRLIWETPDMRERRNDFRVEWNSPSSIYDRNDHFIGLCIVSNFSNRGAKIAGMDPGSIPDEFILRISPRSRAHRCRVTWRSSDGLGVRFSGHTKASSAAALERRQKLLS